MATFLFDRTIFGPIKSRRFGNSLGINLLPVDFKLCNLDCVYCECGWTLKVDSKANLVQTEDVKKKLFEYIEKIKSENIEVNSITFAGNGEPSLHPGFADIIDFTINLRNKFYPDAKVTVLSNGLLIKSIQVKQALQKVDLPVLKLDAGTQKTYQLINRPRSSFDLKKLINEYKKFGKKLIIQSLFLKGEFQGEKFDNTTDNEINNWIKILKELNPSDVMIYSLERDTPAEKLEKIPTTKLNEISDKLKANGIKSDVY